MQTVNDWLDDNDHRAAEKAQRALRMQGKDAAEKRRSAQEEIKHREALKDKGVPVSVLRVLQSPPQRIDDEGEEPSSAERAANFFASRYPFVEAREFHTIRVEDEGGEAGIEGHDLSEAVFTELKEDFDEYFDLAAQLGIPDSTIWAALDEFEKKYPAGTDLDAKHGAAFLRILDYLTTNCPSPLVTEDIWHKMADFLDGKLDPRFQILDSMAVAVHILTKGLSIAEQNAILDHTFQRTDDGVDFIPHLRTAAEKVKNGGLAALKVFEREVLDWDN